MRLRIRIHEWLADRVSWIQYPDANFPEERGFYRNLTRKQRPWFWFAVFWLSVIAFSIYGNLIK